LCPLPLLLLGAAGWPAGRPGVMTWHRPRRSSSLLLLPVVAVAGLLPLAARAACPDSVRFQRWLSEFQAVCSPPANRTGEYSTEAAEMAAREAAAAAAVDGANEFQVELAAKMARLSSVCAWVTCECVEVAQQVPVELPEITHCYEEGMLKSDFTPEQRRTVSELIRGSWCGEWMNRIGAACGDCDRYKRERAECANFTVPPLEIFIPIGAARPSASAPRLLLGALLALPFLGLAGLSPRLGRR